MKMLWSLRADRSEARTLEGAQIPLDTKIYIFVETDTAPVQFYLNDKHIRTEKFAPFDFAATAKAPKLLAKPYVFKTAGPQKITAKSGDAEVIAQFQVGEVSEPEEPEEPESDPAEIVAQVEKLVYAAAKVLSQVKVPLAGFTKAIRAGDYAGARSRVEAALAMGREAGSTTVIQKLEAALDGLDVLMGGTPVPTPEPEPEPEPEPPPTPTGPITLDTSKRFQTWRGWGVTQDAGHESLTDTQIARFLTKAADMVVADGLTTIRVDCPISKGEFPADDWRAGQFPLLDRRIKIVQALDAALNRAGRPPSEVMLTCVDWTKDAQPGANEAENRRNGWANRNLHSNPTEYGNYAFATIEHFKDVVGRYPMAFDVVNEPNLTKWTVQEIGNIVVHLDQRLPIAIRLVVPSGETMSASRQIVDQLMKRTDVVTALKRRKAFLAWHRYKEEVSSEIRVIAKHASDHGLETLQSEDWNLYDGASTIDDLYDDLVNGNVSRWVAPVFASPYRTDGGGAYLAVDKNTFVLKLADRAKTYAPLLRVIPAGSVRVEAKSSDSSVRALGFVKPDGKPIAIGIDSNGKVTTYTAAPAPEPEPDPGPDPGPGPTPGLPQVEVNVGNWQEKMRITDPVKFVFRTGTYPRFTKQYQANQQYVRAAGEKVIWDGEDKTEHCLIGTRGADNVEVVEIEYKRYRPTWRLMGAIRAGAFPDHPDKFSKGLRLRGVYGHHNGEAAVSLGHETVIEDGPTGIVSTFEANGREAVSAHGSKGGDLKYRALRNNTEKHGESTDEAGGSKFVWSTGLRIHDYYGEENWGNDLWFDADCDDCTVEDFEVIRPGRAAVINEIGFAVLVRNGLVREAAYTAQQGPATNPYIDWNCAIHLHLTQNSRVNNVEIVDSFGGAVISSGNRRGQKGTTGRSWLPINNVIENTKTIFTARSKGVVGFVWVDVADAMTNRYDRNQYTYPASMKVFSNKRLTFQQWQATGQDLNSTVTLA